MKVRSAVAVRMCRSGSSILMIYFKSSKARLSHFFFTQCPVREAIQPPCSFRAEPVTSSHRSPATSFLHSLSSASNRQGAVTFHIRPRPPPLSRDSNSDRDTLCCILSSRSGKKREERRRYSVKYFTAPVALRVDFNERLLPCWFLKGQNSPRSSFPSHHT